MNLLSASLLALAAALLALAAADGVKEQPKYNSMEVGQQLEEVSSKFNTIINFIRGEHVDLLTEVGQRVEELSTAVLAIIATINADRATSPRFCAKLKVDPASAVNECDPDWSCAAGMAEVAQQGTYWMPCGALALKPDSKAYKRRLCPARNIITTQRECEAAAKQLRATWEAQTLSGFERSDIRSDIQMRRWTNSQTAWMTVHGWTEYGFSPRFRPGPWHTGEHADGNPAAVMGCSIDPNGNVVYWNPYLIDQPERWAEGAEYTPLGGLIHAGQIEVGDWLDTQIGICKGDSGRRLATSETAPIFT